VNNVRGFQVSAALVVDLLGDVIMIPPAGRKKIRRPSDAKNLPEAFLSPCNSAVVAASLRPANRLRFHAPFPLFPADFA
jgi:hypothetical protein